MTKIAISIVLLPSKKMVSKIIEINKELLKTNKNKIILGKIVNQPHISLCMGSVNKIEIPQIIKSINEISNNFTQFDLEGKLNVQTVSTCEKLSWLEIINKDKIQKIHESVMKTIWKHLSYDIENYMLVNPHEIEEKTISWIKQYSNLYKNPLLFRPHITVGIGDTVKYNRIFKFSSSKIAIFQLGNYCTCKKLIYSTGLN
ncbi:MAG: hypothetical protein L3J20_07100 [Flavobacteriaceae bacterium]|nr:hypothetical protein [Flavobacteriaceae bacterium]